MKKISEPIVFFGSGPVAAKSLELLAKDFNIEAVITKPRPPHHRGEVPVLSLAESLNIPVFTARNKAELDKLFDSEPIKSRIGVLIDFGIIVSSGVINYFPLGIVNSHFSLLPEWRGADPISFAILSGQQQTGVSLMLLVEAMDEGPIIDYATYNLRQDMTTPQLTEALIQLSYKLLIDKLPLYIKGILKPQAQDVTGAKLDLRKTPSSPDRITSAANSFSSSRLSFRQDGQVDVPSGTSPSDKTVFARADSVRERTILRKSSRASYSRKLTKEDGVIDWAKSAIDIEREIRAFIAWPKSRTKIADKDVIITQARVAKADQLDLRLDLYKNGDVIITPDKLLAVKAAEGVLILVRIKPAGKNEMDGAAFIAGYGQILK